MVAQLPPAGRRQRHVIAAALLAAASTLAAGCEAGVPPSPPVAATATLAEPTPEEIPFSTPLPEPTAAPTAAIESEERVAVYRQVVLVLAGAEDAPVVYLNPYLGEGLRLDLPVMDSPLPSALMPALRQADPERTYETAEFMAVVGPLEEGGPVDNGGAYITLGPVEDSEEVPGAVQVRASVYREVANAGGYTYDLRREPSEPGGWVVARATQDWLDRTR